jgi:galactarate dehydratase
MAAIDNTAPASQLPLTIRMHERDNVAIVANDGGLPAGTALPGDWCWLTACRKATRWRWSIWPQTRRVLRYGMPIGYALKRHPGRQLGA